MIRLPAFDYYAPRTITESVDLLAAHPGAMLLAGGTDLVPNMKRRQQTPPALVSLAGVAELKHRSFGGTHGFGAGLTLSEILRDDAVRRECGALYEAAAQVATPHLRAMGTLGGNLCLDTRCNYYDQSYEWRKAIDFCMKKDGERCWVALSSPTCLAVSSTDTAPALIALGAHVVLVSAAGTRTLSLADLYANDGMQYLTRRSDEILTRVDLPDQAGWRSTYWKLRRRGSFDFPVLGVAAAVKLSADGTIEDARIVLGAVASRPLVSERASRALLGGPLSDEAIARAADLAFAIAKPMDNTDFALVWRKRVTRDFVAYALRQLRGDDMRAVRRQLTRRSLAGLHY
ncbi:MAG TPA: xanthine dehydrogenase family protein subunit M [Vicinamibacterales bacterium]|jgi:4-hydroxybenzoyl-CoA reductase subunit beta|nr:xanthine dehydrogenase family protein subunit M [Vicinamibacterales bacterium]